METSEVSDNSLVLSDHENAALLKSFSKKKKQKSKEKKKIRKKDREARRMETEAVRTGPPASPATDALSPLDAHSLSSTDHENEPITSITGKSSPIEEIESGEDDQGLIKLKPPRPPRKKVKETLKEPLYEEDIIEGFSFAAFKTYDDLEVRIYQIILFFFSF